MNGKWTAECKRREIDEPAASLREKYGKRRKIEYVSEIHKECALIIHTTIELLYQRRGARCFEFISLVGKK